MKALFQAIKFEIVCYAALLQKMLTNWVVPKLLKLICFLHNGKSPISIPHPTFLGSLYMKPILDSQCHSSILQSWGACFQRWQRTDTDTPRRTKASPQACQTELLETSFSSYLLNCNKSHAVSLKVTESVKKWHKQFLTQSTIAKSCEKENANVLEPTTHILLFLF